MCTAELRTSGSIPAEDKWHLNLPTCNEILLQLSLPIIKHIKMKGTQVGHSKLHVTCYLVHPHGEGVPVCDQEPLSDVKLGLVNQQRLF